MINKHFVLKFWSVTTVAYLKLDYQPKLKVSKLCSNLNCVLQNMMINKQWYQLFNDTLNASLQRDILAVDTQKYPLMAQWQESISDQPLCIYGALCTTRPHWTSWSSPYVSICVHMLKNPNRQVNYTFTHIQDKTIDRWITHSHKYRIIRHSASFELSPGNQSHPS